MKNFKVKKYGINCGLTRDADYPAKFELELGNEDPLWIREMVILVAGTIIKLKKGPGKRRLFGEQAFSSDRFEWVEELFKSSTDTAAFILRNESSCTINGIKSLYRSEAIYSIDVKCRRIYGKVVDFKEDNNCTAGKRGNIFGLDEIINGHLKYPVKIRSKNNSHDDYWVTCEKYIYKTEKTVARKVSDSDGRCLDDENLMPIDFGGWY